MSEDFREVHNNVIDFLMSLRRSISIRFRSIPRPDETEHELFIDVMIKTEEARLRFESYLRYIPEPTAFEWRKMKDELLASVDYIADLVARNGNKFNIKFRYERIRSRGKSSDDFFRSYPNTKERSTILLALHTFRSYIINLDDKSLIRQSELSFEQLGKIVPGQQVAPVQFEIKLGKIYISQRAPELDQSDAINVHSALGYLNESGSHLIASLEKSNCDRRLLDNVKELHTCIGNKGNIVKIGLMNLACSTIGAHFHNELPDAILGMMNAYNGAVSLYVSQFPEWRQFTEKAASIELNSSDITEIQETTIKLTDLLRDCQNISHPDVPKTIEFIGNFLKGPEATSKKAALAIIRTIENLVSVIIHYASSFLTKTADRVIESGSLFVGNTIIGLLSVALLSASGIGNAALSAGAPWVKQAAEIVQKQINKMSK